MNQDHPNQAALLLGNETLLDIYIVEELAARNIQVTVLVKKLERGQKFKTETSVLKEGTITPQIVPRTIFDGANTVISTLGITYKKKTQFDTGIDYRTNSRLLEDAQKAGVEKLIYVTDITSSLYENPKIAEERNNFILRLRASGIDHTIIQADGLFSDYIDYLDKADKGRVILFGSGKQQFNPIHIKDLATACVDALEIENTEIRIVGPETLTLNEIADAAFKAHKKTSKIVHIPKILGRFFNWVMNRFNSVNATYYNHAPPKIMTKNNPDATYSHQSLALYFQREVDAQKRTRKDG